MKKVLALGVLSLAMFSCKTATSTKNDVATQIKLKGEWTLVDVNYSAGYKVTSFDVADANCFEGSQWKLIPNNNSGTVTLNNPDRSEEHTSELQSRPHLVCRLLLEKKKNRII